MTAYTTTALIGFTGIFALGLLIIVLEEYLTKDAVTTVLAVALLPVVCYAMGLIILSSIH